MAEASHSTSRHGMWTGRWAFVLAASGSAVGLGNIWKFPYITGEYGGAAFVIVYLLCIVAIGFPVMTAEILIGRSGRQSPIGSLLSLSREHSFSPAWSGIGWLGVVTGFVILSFYSVVAGWVLHYLVQTGSGTFVGASATEVKDAFDSFTSSAGWVVFWTTVFLGITAFVVARGVNRGLELTVRYGMPVLVALLVMLALYGVTTGGFEQAFVYLFNPDFSTLTFDALVVAMAHAFFTLSLGMGAMMAYGAYLPGKVSIVEASWIIILVDTVVALLAGLAIFSIVFGEGLDVASGPALMFHSLPIAFGSLPAGTLFGGLFFLLVSIAALTSAISLLEPTVAYLVEKFDTTRMMVVSVVLVICWLLALLSALSFNVLSGVTMFEGKTYFDLFDWLSQEVMLPLGGLLTALFAAWVLPNTVVWKQLELGEGLVRTAWRWLCGVVAPVGILMFWLLPPIRDWIG